MDKKVVFSFDNCLISCSLFVYINIVCGFVCLFLTLLAWREKMLHGQPPVLYIKVRNWPFFLINAIYEKSGLYT